MVELLPGSGQLITICVSVTVTLGTEMVGVRGGPTASVLTTSATLGLSRPLELIAVMRTLGGE